MGRISTSHRSAQSASDDRLGRQAAPAVDSDGGGDDTTGNLIRRLARTHRDLPEEVITRQVGEVRKVLGWLGNDPEVNATLEKAVEHNLSQIETALASGAGLSQQTRDGHDSGRQAAARRRH